MRPLNLLLLASLALVTVTCGGSNDSCPAKADSGITCTDVCGDVNEFRRFPCAKPPNLLCDSQQQPARPLNKTQVDYVVEKCRTCSGCSKGCQTCNAGLPPY